MIAVVMLPGGGRQRAAPSTRAAAGESRRDPVVSPVRPCRRGRGVRGAASRLPGNAGRPRSGSGRHSDGIRRGNRRSQATPAQIREQPH